MRPMPQAVIFIDRLVPCLPPQSHSQGGAPLPPHIRPPRAQTRFRRDVPSHKLALHTPWPVVRRARPISYDSLGIGYRPKIPACMRLRDIIDPKHVRKSFARRHGQVSPDVTHVAVKELIAKGGHATIVST